MKAFLQNEIRLFFSRKNYLVWIVGVLAVVFAYRLYYVTQYENYAQTVLEELEENAKDITIWESEYQRQCMELWASRLFALNSRPRKRIRIFVPSYSIAFVQSCCAGRKCSPTSFRIFTFVSVKAIPPYCPHHFRL